MARSSFVSFHYQKDHSRVQLVLNIGALEEQKLLPAQEWEEVKAEGDEAVEEWINDQMAYKGAVVVMVGSDTANRKWVKYEIQKAWKDRKPLLGVRIHGLKDLDGNTSTLGANPFSQFKIAGTNETYADYVPLFNPTGATSKDVYKSISDNLETWVGKGYKRP